MTSAPVEPLDLLDLKLLPAWVKEPAEANTYADYKARRRGPSAGPAGAPTHRGKRSTQLQKIEIGRQRPFRRASTTQEVAGRAAGRHGAEARKSPRGEEHPSVTAPGRSRFVFCHTPRRSKMLLRKSSPARWHIRCTPWRVCFLKSLNATRFGSWEKRNRGFIALATMAPCL